MLADEPLLPCQIDHWGCAEDAEILLVSRNYLARALLVTVTMATAELALSWTGEDARPSTGSRASYPYPYGKYQHSAYYYLKCCREEWCIHVAISNPRDRRQLRRYYDYGRDKGYVKIFD